ncbi:MAG: FAD-dependent oxidoreductase [Bacteroidetes bacterium]|nr:FAD-dependent oxidoreductase [Bacteroidota bacterium]
MKRKVIVIGGVAAGPSAATKAKRVSPDSEVILYEQGEHISYGVCEIPYFISGEIQRAESLIIYSPERLQKEKGVTAKILHRVEEIIPSQREILVRNLSSSKITRDWYDKLIIASGTKNKKFQIAGEESRNVFYVKSLNDAYALKKFIQENKPKNAVVIGAGFIGMEMTEALTKIGMDVTVVHNSALPMSLFEEEGKKIILSALEAQKVRFIPDAKVEWFGVGAHQNVVAVGLPSQTIETDLVIIAAGVKPNSELAKNAGIHLGKAGGILVSDRMHALGADNIFAAGDCCEVKNILTKKPEFISLATIASKTGRIAGENSVGGNEQFKGMIRAIGIKIFNLEAAQVGLSSKEAAAAGLRYKKTEVGSQSKVGMMPGVQKISLTLLSELQTGRILGANVIGAEGAVQRANVLAAAIRHGLTITDLSELDLIYAPPFAPLWDGIIQSGIQAKK